MSKRSAPCPGVALARCKNAWKFLLLVPALAAIAVGCSSSHPSSDAPAAPAAKGAQGAYGAAQAPAPAPQGVLATPSPGLDPSRQIAYTSAITVQVGSVEASMASVLTLTSQLGGFLFSQESSFQAGPQASLSLRIPPGQFRAALAQLAALGKVLNQSVTAEDVTQQVADLDGRLKTVSASAERLRGLLAKANGTPDIVAIESELEKREVEIESLQGQINALANRVNYATINVTLSEQGTAKVSNNIPTFRRSLHGGWVALVNVGKVAVAVLGASLPFLPFVALGIFLLLRYRRWRKAHPRPPDRRPPGGPPWPPTPAHPAGGPWPPTPANPPGHPLAATSHPAPLQEAPDPSPGAKLP